MNSAIKNKTSESQQYRTNSNPKLAKETIKICIRLELKNLNNFKFEYFVHVKRTHFRHSNNTDNKTIQLLQKIC